ncbi:MAG: Cobyrinic acid ac-diamide synthase [Gemmatimonadetes bacterium]|nr:Cobyrinic acid ac-diamide synthase [Gemmatimonadota bacterium]
MRPERIVLVAGGREGVGTSVAASLLALVCAGEGSRVLLVDGNTGLHSLFGFHPLTGLDALADSNVAVSDVLVAITEQLSFAPGTRTVQDMAPAMEDGRHTPFERLFAEPDFDVVIVDAGARLENVLAATQSGIGSAVIVSDTDRTSLAASYALLKVLAQHAPTVRCHVLVNRHDEATARAASGQLSNASVRFLERDLSSSGSLPDDACLRAALGAGMPIGDAAEGSPAARAMLSFAERVLPSVAGRMPATAGSHLNENWS